MLDITTISLPENAEQVSIDPEPVPSALELDIKKYLPYLKDFEMSEEDGALFLSVIWDMMTFWVERGYHQDLTWKLFKMFNELARQDAERAKLSSSQTFQAAPVRTEANSWP